ncbi:MAG: diguanylate cyclase [Thermoguttaceae bacterium]
MSNNEETNMMQSANVLVVDDDPAITQLLTHLLEMGGHSVRAAADGNECLQMILQECPDVLIADWNMPGLDGLELCQRVRELHTRKVLPHYTYILLLTAQSGKHYLIEGLEAGADDFIEKTYDSIVSLQVEIKARLNSALRTRRLEQNLEFAAKYDALTSLLNRLTFFELAQVIWERSILNKFPLSAIMLDCDFFKRVNDIHGHAAGDIVLREIAHRIKESSRASDIVCRYGGEEFCVLLPGCDEITAWSWAERIRLQFESSPINRDNLDIGVTVSFGIAERLDKMTTFDTLVENADQSLLMAKDSGRNRCVRHSMLDMIEAESPERLRGTRRLFDGFVARDVMTPFSTSLNADVTVATAAEMLLRSGDESLPVVDSDGNLLGMAMEKNLISAIGNLERWSEPLGDLLTTTVVSYPTETPLRVIYEFLCRVTTSRIILVNGKMPAGYIDRIPFFAWLRGHWAKQCENPDDVIPQKSQLDV